MRVAAGLIVSCVLVGPPLVQAQVPERPSKRLQVGQVLAARPADAPTVQDDTPGDVHKTGDENDGAQLGPAVLGQQPSPPLPILTTPSDLENPFQPGDTTEAKRTLGRACDRGEFRGCYTLGVLEHESGNLAEAKRLFAKACEGGDMGGCNNLGLLEKQAGNLALARRLYARACVGNDMRACTNLGALEKQAGNLAEARLLFVQACNAGEAPACIGLNALEGKAQAQSVEKPLDADTPEHGHLGPVLGMTKGLGLGGPKFAYGLRGGLRISHIEIGFLVGSSGKFGQESGNISGDLAAYPILFPLNGILEVNSILSWVLGGQVGLMHYRKHVDSYWQTGIGSPYSTVHGDATTNVFAYGFQTGPAVRLAAHVSLRFEFALTHAGKAFVTVTNKHPDGSSTEVGVGIDAQTFLNLSGALCLTL